MAAGLYLAAGYNPHIVVAFLEARRSQGRYVVFVACDLCQGIVQIILCPWAVALRLCELPLGVDIAAAPPPAQLLRTLQAYA